MLWNGHLGTHADTCERGIYGLLSGNGCLGLGGCLRHTLCQHLFQHLLIDARIHGTLHSPAHSIGDSIANRTRDGIAEIDGAVGTQPLIRIEES